MQFGEAVVRWCLVVEYDEAVFGEYLVEDGSGVIFLFAQRCKFCV